jgi:WD40 repeat protein
VTKSGESFLPEGPRDALPLRARLVEQVESGALPEAHATLTALLAHEPGDADLWALRKYLEAELSAHANTTPNNRCLQGHGAPVTAVAFSADGRYVLSGSGSRLAEGPDGLRPNKPVLLWEVSTGQNLGGYKGHSSDVTCVAFSPTEAQAASASRGGSLCIWDTIARRVVRTIRRREGVVRSVGFSPDGRRLLSGGEDGVVRVWDLETGERVCRGEGHATVVTAVAWFRDGRVASAGLDGSVRVWDGQTGQELQSWRGHAGGALAVAVSADANWLLSGGRDHVLRLWDARSGRERGEWATPTSGTNAVTYSPGGTRALSGGSDGAVRLWDVGRGREAFCFTGHSGGVTSVAFSPDGRLAASGSLDQTVRLWTLPPS